MADEQKDTQWESFSELVPERTDVELPEEESELLGDSEDMERGSLTRRMKLSPKLSDAQTFDLRLFPDLGTQYLNHLMVSQVFPDNYNHLLSIIVKDLMRRDKTLTLTEAIVLANTALSIGLDREGRIDTLVLSGAAQAQAEEEKNKLGNI